MITVKGFVEVQKLIDNTPNALSVIGELSPLSATYSREKAEYSSSLAPGFALHTMFSKNADGEDISLPIQVSDILLKISNSILTYCSLRTRPYDEFNFTDTITAEYTGIIRSFKKGSFVDGVGLGLPQWISFEIIDPVVTNVRIWFSDSAFSSQYDSYSITVVSPVDTPDIFFSPPNDVKKLVSSFSLSTLLDKANELKTGKPETVLRSVTVNYTHPALGAGEFPVEFAVLVYGQQGDNVDVIKDTVIEYLVSNSTKTRQEWEVIFPSLFKRTEFVVIPRWDRFSIPNMLLKSGLYSSIVNPNECMDKTVSLVTFYTEQQIRSNTVFVPFPYKGINLSIVNGPGNDGDNARFDIKFSDYLPEQPTSLDFNRMNIRTQEMILMLNEMLILSDNYTLGTVFPKKYRTIWRDGKMFLSRVFDKAQYLVLVRT